MSSTKSSSRFIPPETSPASLTPPAQTKSLAPLETHLTVIHPAGFTPHAHADTGRKKPLFARVTYRPH